MNSFNNSMCEGQSSIGRLWSLLNLLFLGLNVWFFSTNSMDRQVHIDGEIETKNTSLCVERGELDIVSRSHAASPDNNDANTVIVHNASSTSAFQPDPIRDWCPKKFPCHSTVLCQPCKQRYLIILATGRSGSTTIMEMLGSLPNVRMAGENQNALKRIYNFHTFLETTGNLHLYDGAGGAWDHRPVPEQGLACSDQSFIEAINPPALTERGDYKYPKAVVDPILGFKTIRFLEDLNHNLIPEAKISSYMNWFIKSFPCARIVVNVRSDAAAQAKSQIKAFRQQDEKHLEANLERDTNAYKDLASRFGDRAYLMDSVEWTKDVTKFHGLIDWLGFSKECYFKYLLEYNTKGGGYGAGVTSYRHDPNCRYTGEHKPLPTR